MKLLEEGWAQAFAFIERNAWVLAIVSALVLFAPDDIASKLKIDGLRASWEGVLWIVLVITALMTVGAIVRSIVRPWLSDRRQRKEREVAAVETQRAAEKTQKNFESTLDLRLRSLNEKEYEILLYCVVRRVQSFNGSVDQTTIASLCSKSLVEQGGGTVFSCSFHVPDPVWTYLLANQAKYLRDADLSDPNLATRLEETKKSFHVRRY